MTDQELRKLSRKDLLELLLAQSREQEALRAELEQARELLRDRQIHMEQIGSIAEAALQVNGVFEAAQAAAQQYLENVRQRSEMIEAACARRDADSKAAADRLLQEATQRTQQMEAETKRRCEQMEAEARQKSEAYWAEVSVRLQAFYQEHKALKEILALGDEHP